MEIIQVQISSGANKTKLIEAIKMFKGVKNIAVVPLSGSNTMPETNYLNRNMANRQRLEESIGNIESKNNLLSKPLIEKL